MEILLQLSDIQENALTFIAGREGSELSPTDYLISRVTVLLNEYVQASKLEDISIIYDAMSKADGATTDSIKATLGISKSFVFDRLKVI